MFIFAGMNILYILPHCSTGGLPQYTLKMVEEFSRDNVVTVVEVSNLSDEYVVQRNRIRNLVSFKQLHGDAAQLIDLIASGYDVIHFQEIPETFISEDILDKIYVPDREYSIVVTTHSSYTNPSTIKYTADRYVLVSNWSKQVFENHYQGSVECAVWEYPIETVVYDKQQARQVAGFEDGWKHVLHVGLFTPGKNQKELIQIARLSLQEKIKFHFVGNQASNFQHYWQPLMQNLPANCIWHGEREDVDVFYKAADAFYFPSLFELNPISLKEALSFGVPILVKKLHTYDEDLPATFLTDDVIENQHLLYNVLGVQPTVRKIQALHLLTYSNDPRQQKSIAQLSKLSEYGIHYKQLINDVYDDLPPTEFCKRPEHVRLSGGYIGNGLGYLTGRHYGCFLAHTNAIRSIQDDVDYTIIFEGDASIEGCIEEFAEIIKRACVLTEREENVVYISFGSNPAASKTPYDDAFCETSARQDLTHCYLVPTRCKDWYIRGMETVPWDGYDVWLNEVFFEYGGRRFTTNKVWSDQMAGVSLIDHVMKWEKFTHYNYIEIGTSDFDTLVQIYPEGTMGLSIEPIKTYLDRLPDKSGNTKLNAAITDQDCQLSVFYVKPEDIEANGLPEWVKGCNSVGAPHPSVVRELTERNLMHLYTQDTIDGISFPSLINECKIDGVDYLKVDTEGHDAVILRSMLKTSLRPTKVRFEANALYKEQEILDIISEMSDGGYKLVQRTRDDVVMRLKQEIDNSPYTAPVLIISSGRRWKYFEKTVQLLVEKNPDIAQIVKKVWVLDDRSTIGDRVNMELLMSRVFGDKWGIISFNGNQPFDFVDKFRMIPKLIEPTDVVFLLEDDWECHDYLHLPYHINRLQTSSWTQIAFADPLEIQDADTQNLTRIDEMYWKNPFPGSFKHPIRWNGDMCWWVSGSINNYTNNPSLIKGEVFFRAEYIKHKNFEASFAGQINGNQVFTQEALFRHFGEDSLINQL